MSIACIKNLRQAKCNGRFIRAPKLARDDVRFFDDIGFEPPTPAQVYQTVAEQGPTMRVFTSWRQRKPLGVRHESHVVPSDCNAAFNEGLDRFIREEEEYHAQHDDGYQDWLEREAEFAWDALTPQEDIRKAWLVVEEEEWERMDRAWAEFDAHVRNELEEAPIFMHRVRNPARVLTLW